MKKPMTPYETIAEQARRLREENTGRVLFGMDFAKPGSDRTTSELRCKHGPILYGTHCVQCDREASAAPPHEGPVHAAFRAAEERRKAGSFDYVWETRPDHRVRPDHFHKTEEEYRAYGEAFWERTYSRNPVEIITDPNDTRGVNARRVGESRCA